MTDATMGAGDGVDPGVNAVPDPSLFGPQDGMRKKRKTKKPDDGGSLSINSLMDVLTIILVFLLKSYSNNPVQLKQSEGLQLPFSKAKMFPSESVAVTITSKDIIVNDERATLLEDEGKKIPESDLTSGGMLIEPLFQKLQDAVDHEKRIAKFNKNKEFSGIITVICDRGVPFSILTKVMYTAGQAQFSKFKFAVVNEDAG